MKHSNLRNNHHRSSARVQRTRSKESVCFSHARGKVEIFPRQGPLHVEPGPAFSQVCECKWITVHNRPGGEGEALFSRRLNADCEYQ